MFREPITHLEKQMLKRAVCTLFEPLFLVNRNTRGTKNTKQCVPQSMEIEQTMNEGNSFMVLYGIVWFLFIHVFLEGFKTST